MMNTKILLLAMLLGVLSFVETKGQDHYDIVVYGGTSAGVTAAVQAARMGRNVVMVCPGQNIGGLTSSGLGATDINNREAIGGIAREFYSRIYKYYSHKSAWNYTTRESYFDLVNNWPSGNKKVQRVWGGKNDVMEIMWVFEPHVAQKYSAKCCSKQVLKLFSMKDLI